MSESDLTMWVLDRWSMVGSAPFCHRSAQMSWAELFEPITTTFLPEYFAPPGCWEEWCWSPRNTSWPGSVGTLGSPDMPVAITRCVGVRVSSRPSRVTVTVH